MDLVDPDPVVGRAIDQPQDCLATAMGAQVPRDRLQPAREVPAKPGHGLAVDEQIDGAVARAEVEMEEAEVIVLDHEGLGAQRARTLEAAGRSGVAEALE